MSASFSAQVNPGGSPTAEETAHPLGNSERIRMKFGNFGIEVLESDAGIRVSNLYSTHDNVRISRTFAVVAYPENIEPAFRKEHDAIIDGQSIGIVFKNNGWVIEKHHQYFGEIELPLHLFGIASHSSETGKARSAIHVYSLIVKKGESEFQYASIAEVHHPEFLQLQDLASIYGSEFENHRDKTGEIAETLDKIESRILAL
jgi:hypothetical protein